jgi:hypothetical protein
VSFREYTADLRLPFDLPDGQFDVVLAPGGVVAHQGQPTARHGHGLDLPFQFQRSSKPFRRNVSGIGPRRSVRHHVAECYVDRHTLKSGKRRASLHVRAACSRVTPTDVFNLAAHCGFEKGRFDTFFSWGVAPHEFRLQALGFLAASGFSQEHRGDDAYYEFRRPL